MAAYNAADYISESIKSILTQTFTDLELLIVNDGSTDNTVQVVESFTDPRIRLVHNEKNRGLVFTRNVALKEARGEYIAVLDSDDIASPGRLESQYAFFQQNPDFALCGGHGTIINSQGEHVEDNRLMVPTDPDGIKMTLLFLNTYVNSAVMYKTSILKELGGYEDYAPAEDYDLFIRMADKYPVGNLDKVLVKYRDHNSNTSIAHAEIGKVKVIEIKRKQLARLNMPTDKRTVNTFYSLLAWDFSYDFADYLDLFNKFKLANQTLKKYPEIAFEQKLFDYWFLIILTKKAKMNAMALLFNKKIFKWSYVNARQLRKTFKLSLRGLGSISN